MSVTCTDPQYPIFSLTCSDGSIPVNGVCATGTPVTTTTCGSVPAGDTGASLANIDNIKVASYQNGFGSMIESANTAPLDQVLWVPTASTPVTSLPAQIQTALDGCTGSCKYVAADFSTGTFTQFTSLSYVIDTSMTAPVDRGVFANTASGDPLPITFISPLGYTFEGAPFDIKSSTLGASMPKADIEQCAVQCDSTTNCTGFNFGEIDSTCQLFQGTPNTSTDPTLDAVGFAKETFYTDTTSPSAPSNSNLQARWTTCSNALACNNDITRLIISCIRSHKRLNLPLREL